MKFFRLMLLITAIFAAIWLGGLLWFKQQVDQHGPKEPQHADAVVALTGGALRLSEGIHLLEQDYAQKMLISGTAPGITLPKLFKSLNQKWPEDSALTDRISLGAMARDTWGNAQETARWMAENHFSSMLLVTSNYHMPRALLECMAAMPEVEIITYPVVPEQVQLEEWWKHPGTRKLIISEYNKFLGVSLRLVFRQRAL